MSILAEAFHPRAMAATPGDSAALNDFWYRDRLTSYALERDDAGLALSGDTILLCTTVLAAVRFKADLLSMLKPTVFRRQGFGRVEDRDTPAQAVLDTPNVWQTANRWRHLQVVWLSLWGSAPNELIPGARSFADELQPLHPRHVSVVDQRNDGSRVYLYRPPGEPERRIGQDRMLYFQDMSTDSFGPLVTYQLIRNVVGIALLAERHQATFLKKGARISGLLVPEKPLEANQRKILRESVNKEIGGTNMTGAFGILPSGVKLEPITMNHREGQLIELGDRAVSAILMGLGVPGVVVGWQGDKTSTYASAEAYFEKGGIRHTAQPLVGNMEDELGKSLLLRGDQRVIEFNLDALMRGAWRDRVETLVKAAGGPIFTRNEARDIENYDPLPGKEFDTILTPANMDDGEEEPEPPPPLPSPMPRPEPDNDGDEDAEAVRLETEKLRAELASERERLSALESKTETQGRLLAERVIRREMRAVTERAKAHAQDGEAWEKWLRGYYARHVSHVMEALGCSEQSARVHCERQADGLIKDGLGSMETWENGATARLIAIAGERGN